MTENEYTTVSEHTHEFPPNQYVEVARKRHCETKEEFLLVSRGYYDKHGKKLSTRWVTIPAQNHGVLQWLRDVLHTELAN